MWILICPSSFCNLQDLETQKAELEIRVEASEKKKQELETSLTLTNQNLVHVNAERLTLKSEVDKLTKESAQLKSQLQQVQSQLETLQAQRPKIDNADIQRKYQVSFSSLSLLISI